MDLTGKFCIGYAAMLLQKRKYLPVQVVHDVDIFKVKLPIYLKNCIQRPANSAYDVFP